MKEIVSIILILCCATIKSSVFTGSLTAKQIPVKFIENKGQVTDMNGEETPFVLFTIECKGINLFVTEQGLTYVLVKKEKEHEEDEHADRSEKGLDKEPHEWNRIDMFLKDANIKKENIITEGESTYSKQFFLGHCPNGIVNVHDYEKITIREVYPGIDWVLYNSSKVGFKYDFIVHPNGDPNDIELVYLTKNPVLLTEQGNLTIQNEIGTINENAPVSFLGNETVETKFVTHYSKEINVNEDKGYETSIKFNFGGNDLLNREKDLIVDPQLSWATFYGGNGADGPSDIIADAVGNVFVSGYTSSSNFPTQNNGNYFQGTSVGSEAFIFKFNTAGVLMWSTYYGGNGSETACSMCFDQAGDIFLTGLTTSTNFPLQNAGTFFQPTYGGGAWGDAFIMKFTSNGVRLWATYYGGSSGDFAYDVDCDATGNVFITGYTSSINFPLQNAGTYFQPTLLGVENAYIVKFSNAGTRLWATYYGGNGNDGAYSLDVDVFGNVFVSGRTNSVSFPVLNAGTFFQGTNGGGYDAFLIKFNNAGVRLWATYYGGSGDDVGMVVTDGVGNLFVNGETTSLNFPTQNAGTFFQAMNAGGKDAFVLKFNNSGLRTWATYYGGSGNESIGFNNSVIGPNNKLFITWTTGSTNIPLQNSSTSYNDASFNGGVSDIFIVEFTGLGVLNWATYLGGDGDDFKQAITLDNTNSLFVTGEWTSVTNNSSYPLINPGGGAFYNTSINTFMGHDGYLCKFSNNENLVLTDNISLCYGTSTVISIPNPNNLTNVSYSIQPGASSQTSPNFTISPTSNTSYTLYLTGTNSVNVVVTNSAIINVNIFSAPLVSPSVTNGTCLNPVTSSVNLNLSFSPLGNPNYTVNWNPLPSTVTTINSSTAAGLVPGVNNVTVTTANGCTVVSSFSVLPVPLPASFVIINPNNDYTITCINTNVLLTTSVTNGNPLTFTWLPVCQPSLVATSMNFTQSCNGQVIGTSSTGCSFTQSFTIYQNFTSPTVAVTPTLINIDCVSPPPTFTGTSNLGPNITSNWYQIVGTNTIYVGVQQGTINIFAPGQPGVYWFESVYNITGCKTTQSVQVNASIGVPVFTVTSPTNFTIGCSSKSVTSMQVTSVITSPIPNVAVQYTFIQTPITSTPTTFSVNPNLNNITIPGTYVVYVKDLTNNCVSSQSISIIQNTITPNISFIQPLPQLTCKDFSMVMTGICSNTNTQITWTIPALPGNSVNPTPHTTVTINASIPGATNNVTSIGVWTVGAIDNNNFCVSTRTVQVVQDIRVPKFTISAFTNSVINCINYDVVIVPVVTPSLAAALVPTYVWYPPVGNPLPGTSFNTSSPGTHTSISISAVNGCSFLATYNVAVDLNAPALNPVGAFTLDCNDVPTVMLTPSITGSTAGFTYSWTIPSGALTSNTTGSVLTTNRNGYYVLSVTNTLNGCVSYMGYEVVNGGINADFMADAEFGYAPLVVTFTNTSYTSNGSNNIISTWGYGNGAVTPVISNTITTTATYTASGTYSVILNVKKGSCTDTTLKIIRVELPSRFEVPNIFTPNGDGTNDIFRLRRASSVKNIYIVIFDRWGTKTYELTSDTGNFAWDGKDQNGKDCSDGTYFYILKAQGIDAKEFDLKGNVSLFR